MIFRRKDICLQSTGSRLVKLTFPKQWPAGFGFSFSRHLLFWLKYSCWTQSPFTRSPSTAQILKLTSFSVSWQLKLGAGKSTIFMNIFISRALSVLCPPPLRLDSGRKEGGWGGGGGRPDRHQAKPVRRRIKVQRAELYFSVRVWYTFNGSSKCLSLGFTLHANQDFSLVNVTLCQRFTRRQLHWRSSGLPSLTKQQLLTTQTTQTEQHALKAV